MIELRTLGALDLRDSADGRSLQSVLAQPKRAAFLAYLALSGGRFHRRDTLLGVFWPDSPERHARHSLSQAVYLLRRSLGAEAIQVRGEEELAISPDRVHCDAVEFDRLIGAGDDAGALELYGGELLAGFHLGDSLEFEKWLSGERLRLQVAAVTATRRLAAAAEAAGDSPGAIRRLRRGVEWAPYDEALRRELMMRLARTGDRTGALLEHEALGRQLRRDLEIEPAAETESLAAEIRAGAGPSLEERRGAARTSALPRTPATVRAERVRRLVRSRIRRAAIVLPILLLAGATPLVVWHARRATSAAIPASDDRIAVLPFDVRGSERLAYLGEGMALLLGAKLDGAGALRGVDPEAVFNHVDAHPDARNGERGRDVARRFGAGQYVLGTVVEAGGRISVRVGLYDRDGTLRSQASAHTADEAGVFALVDDVARTLIASRLGGQADRLTRIAAQTTSSLPALKAYLAGERAFRQGRFTEAAAAFERAALSDSTFALAHYRLSLASLWAEVPDTLPFDTDARALRHSSRLSEHDRQLLLAYDAWRRGAASEAERIYRNVLGLYPDDGEAALMLGETMFHYNPTRGRPIAESRAAFERVLRVDPRNWGALWHLLLVAGSDRRLEDFRTFARRLRALDPSESEALELRALSAFLERDESAIFAALSDLGSAHPLETHDVAWRLAVYLHDPQGAMRVLRAGARNDRDHWFRQNAGIQLGWLAYALGQDEVAARELRAVEGLDDVGAVEVIHALALGLPYRPPASAERRRALRARLESWPAPPNPVEPNQRRYYAAIADLAAGDTAAALHEAAIIEQSHAADDVPFVAWIRAEVALRAGRPAEALRRLEEAPLERWFGWANSTPIQGGSNLRWTRAEALRALGRDDEALGWYATFGENGIHDLAWLAPAHLRSAGIHERRGRPELAADHYRRAIALWAGADPALQPAVAAARARLRALE